MLPAEAGCALERHGCLTVTWIGTDDDDIPQFRLEDLVELKDSPVQMLHRRLAAVPVEKLFVALGEGQRVDTRATNLKLHGLVKNRPGLVHICGILESCAKFLKLV